jgi:ABC-type transporter MlaC component
MGDFRNHSDDGVSLVANYKTQFSRITQRGSFAELLKALRQKAGS